MLCTKCGQELKEGARFCTKCGMSFKQTENTALPITLLILSAIGIIVAALTEFIIEGNYIIGSIAWLIVYISLLFAVIIQNKQKSTIGFFAVLIPCAFSLIMQIYTVVWFVIHY